MSRDKQGQYKISKESVDKIFSKKDIDILGYESPIQTIIGQMRMEYENGIYKAIQERGVTVDKDELIKALQYDRNQYDKGYINGYNRKASEVARAIFDNIRILGHIDFDGNVCIRKDSFDELKKKYTESEKDNGKK